MCLENTFKTTLKFLRQNVFLGKYIYLGGICKTIKINNIFIETFTKKRTKYQGSQRS